MSYHIDIRFKTGVERTPRVLEMAEAFGLGLSDKEFVVFDKVDLDVRPGDVVYITGQSGAGKSLLLRELARQMAAEGRSICDINELELADRPVIELLGKTPTEATHLLSLAGISDAWIYIRRPRELSDGQRYRLKLALMIEQNADVWIADEFGAVLDRVTAKVIAYNLAKIARRQNKTLIVATTHTDLVEELGPDLVVEKRFREKVRVSPPERR